MTMMLALPAPVPQAQVSTVEGNLRIESRWHESIIKADASVRLTDYRLLKTGCFILSATNSATSLT